MGVALRVAGMLFGKTEKELRKKLEEILASVIDFHDMPEVMGRPLAEDRVPEYVKTENFAGRGECDIKAYSWMPVSRCILMDSIDGDYLPLTLLQQERSPWPHMCDAWLRALPRPLWPVCDAFTGRCIAPPDAFPGRVRWPSNECIHKPRPRKCSMNATNDNAAGRAGCVPCFK